MAETAYQSLLVHGYQAQSDSNVGQVNMNKLMEEDLLRRLDALKGIVQGADGHRWLAIGRTHIEEGFMAINRAIFQPSRVKLPSDVNAGD